MQKIATFPARKKSKPLRFTTFSLTIAEYTAYWLGLNGFFIQNGSYSFRSGIMTYHGRQRRRPRQATAQNLRAVPFGVSSRRNMFDAGLFKAECGSPANFRECLLLGDEPPFLPGYQPVTRNAALVFRHPLFR
jgi:hypothetical protein